MDKDNIEAAGEIVTKGYAKQAYEALQSSSQLVAELIHNR
jgi:hypothetical protein